MKAKAAVHDYDDYLALVSPEKRALLEKLRKTIKSAAPKAEEFITYQLPGFRLNGRALVAIGAAAKHIALYPMSGRAIDAHRSELEGYETSKGTIRFPLDRPIPTALVKKLVKTRIAENELREKQKREKQH